MRRTDPYLRAIALFVLGASGCFSNTIETNTEFPKQLQACSSVIECSVLKQQAQRDVAVCPKQVTIYMIAPGPKQLACDQANKNLKDAEAKVAKFQAADEEKRQAAIHAQQEQQIQQRADMLHAQQEQRAQMERRGLEQQLAMTQRIVDNCDLTKDARQRRAKHAEMMRQTPNPAEIVKKQCTPQRQTNAVQAQCTDSNGFVRTCTKQVAGDVVGFVCPKTVDPDIAKLGAYQLGLQENGYPFPDEMRVGRDQDCDGAGDRLKAIKDKLGPHSPDGGAP